MAKESKLGTMMYAKDQRVISDKYRKNYETMKWESLSKDEQKKLGFKVVVK